MLRCRRPSGARRSLRAGASTRVESRRSLRAGPTWGYRSTSRRRAPRRTLSGSDAPRWSCRCSSTQSRASPLARQSRPGRPVAGGTCLSDVEAWGVQYAIGQQPGEKRVHALGADRVRLLAIRPLRTGLRGPGRLCLAAPCAHHFHNAQGRAGCMPSCRSRFRPDSARFAGTRRQDRHGCAWNDEFGIRPAWPPAPSCTGLPSMGTSCSAAFSRRHHAPVALQTDALLTGEGVLASTNAARTARLRSMGSPRTLSVVPVRGANSIRPRSGPRVRTRTRSTPDNRRR